MPYLQKRGHFARQCRSSKAHYVEDENSEDEEAFFIHAVKTTASQPALVTCTVNDSHKVTFKINTGASCNVLPLSDYIKATGDTKGTLIAQPKLALLCTTTPRQHQSVKLCFELNEVVRLTAYGSL